MKNYFEALNLCTFKLLNVQRSNLDPCLSPSLHPTSLKSCDNLEYLSEYLLETGTTGNTRQVLGAIIVLSLSKVSEEIGNITLKTYRIN